jgi:hypothetical protein
VILSDFVQSQARRVFSGVGPEGGVANVCGLTGRAQGLGAERERLNWWQSIVFSALGIVGFVLGAILIAAVSGLTQGS